MFARALICIAIFVAVSLTLGANVSVAQDLSAYRTIRFNNENWHVLPHPKVAAFSVHSDGNMNGVTEDGRIFLQYVVPNPYGIRVHRFEIDDHYHYIVDGEIADSFTEFSALLARAYERSITG
jgi:hypothetical protein